MAHGRLYTFLYRRWWLTFLLFGASFGAGGLVTLDLMHTLSANFDFLAMYRLDAVREGGLRQLLGLLASGYFAAACYIVFKACEKILVERLFTPKEP